VARKNLALALIAAVVAACSIIALSALRLPSQAQGADAQAPTEVPAHPTKVLFSGDSISDGWYASVKAKGFVYLVERSINSTQSIHTHHHGYTVGQVGEKFDIPTNVDLAIVELGTNDVNKGTTYEAFGINYPQYIDRVIGKSPGASLICLGVFPNTPRAHTFDGVIQNACESHQGRFIPISDLRLNKRAVGPVGKQTWIGRANLGHPNDYGHAVIAQRIMDIVHSQS